MNTREGLVTDVQRYLQRQHSVDELSEIYAENNTSRWSPDAFEAIRRILEKVGAALPEQVPEPRELERQKVPLTSEQRDEMFNAFLCLAGVLGFAVSSVFWYVLRWETFEGAFPGTITLLLVLSAGSIAQRR